MFRKKPALPVNPPEWLIVGLGNPGPEYKHTRHNVGFDLIDLLAERHRIKVGTGRHRALIGTGEIDGIGVALIKPLTFMNVSGQSVAPLARQFAIKPARILVIADDLDLPLGKLRLRDSGSSGGHNGHKSIIAALGTQEYPRLKIGIGANKDETIDHVLGRFNPEDRTTINEALRAAAETIESLVHRGFTDAQGVIERYHR
jgi:peptidyl-tRNA hydrolase, PTH1 family